MAGPFGSGSGGGIGRVPGAGGPVIPLPASDQPYDPLHTLKLAAQDQYVGEFTDWMEQASRELDIDADDLLMPVLKRHRQTLSYIAWHNRDAAIQILREPLITPTRFFQCTSLLEKRGVDSWFHLFRRPLHGLLRLAIIHHAAMLACRGEDVELGRPINIERSWLPDEVWQDLEQTRGFPYGDIDSSFRQHLERTSVDIRTPEAGIMVYWSKQRQVFGLASDHYAKRGVMQRIRLCQAIALASHQGIPWVETVLYGDSHIDEGWFGGITKVAHALGVRMSLIHVPFRHGSLQGPDEASRRLIFESGETFAEFLEQCASSSPLHWEWMDALEEARGDRKLDLELPRSVISGVKLLQFREIIGRLLERGEHYLLDQVLTNFHALLESKLKAELKRFELPTFAKRVDELKSWIAGGRSVVPSIWRKQLRKPFEQDMAAAYERIQRLERLVHPEHRGRIARGIAGEDRQRVRPNDTEPISRYFRNHASAHLAQEYIAELKTDALPEM
ncbi:MAG: hypothetical protein JRE40_15085, partial [Deltaproteobacteria bacterium]|nr:hypothetical protein [Deltaproteobacteria bacterium]